MPAELAIDAEQRSNHAPLTYTAGAGANPVTLGTTAHQMICYCLSLRDARRFDTDCAELLGLSPPARRRRQRCRHACSRAPCLLARRLRAVYTKLGAATRAPDTWQTHLTVHLLALLARADRSHTMSNDYDTLWVQWTPL